MCAQETNSRREVPSHHRNRRGWGKKGAVFFLISIDFGKVASRRRFLFLQVFGEELSRARARTCFFPFFSYAVSTTASTEARVLSSSPRLPEAPVIIVPQTLRRRRDSMTTLTATRCFWCCCCRGRCCCDGCTAPRTAGIPEATRSLRAWSKRTRLAPVKVRAAIASLYSGPRWVLFYMYRAFVE